MKETTMTVAERAKQILDLSKLELPPRPRIVEVEAEEFVDHMGDDALWIYLYIAEDTLDKDYDAGSIIQIRRVISDFLSLNGVEQSVYTRILKKSEYEAAFAEDDQTDAC